MPIDKQALQTNFAPFVRKARQGLQTALGSQTNLARQGRQPVGQGVRKAMHGYGDILSQGFGSALATTEQQRQFGINQKMLEKQMDDQHDADTLSGIGSVIGIGGDILDIVSGSKSLMDIFGKAKTTTTPITSTPSQGSFEATSSATPPQGTTTALKTGADAVTGLGPQMGQTFLEGTGATPFVYDSAVGTVADVTKLKAAEAGLSATGTAVGAGAGATALGTTYTASGALASTASPAALAAAQSAVGGTGVSSLGGGAGALGSSTGTTVGTAAGAYAGPLAAAAIGYMIYENNRSGQENLGKDVAMRAALGMDNAQDMVELENYGQRKGIGGEQFRDFYRQAYLNDSKDIAPGGQGFRDYVDNLRFNYQNKNLNNWLAYWGNPNSVSEQTLGQLNMNSPYAGQFNQANVERSNVQETNPREMVRYLQGIKTNKLAEIRKQGMIGKQG